MMIKPSLARPMPDAVAAPTTARADASLKRQLVMLGVVPCAAASFLLTAYFTADKVVSLDDRFVSSGDALARRVAAASDLSLFAGDTATLRRIGESAMAEADVVAVEISNSQGVFVSLGSRSAGSADTRAFTAPVQFRSVEALGDYPRGSGEDRDDDRQLGIVRIVLDTQALGRRKLRSAVVGLAIAFGSLGLALLYARRIVRQVVDPLDRLASTVLSIRHGQLDVQAPLQGNTEIVSLAIGINGMATSLRSHRRELESKVRQATAQALERLREAEQAGMSKSRFLAAASHDLRQPLHALGFFVAGLRETATPEQQPLVRKIDEGLQSISNLLSALLDISRLEADVLTPQRQTLPLQPLFDSVADVVRPLAAERGVQLRLRGSSACVESDPVLVGRLLNNLVANAVQYAPNGRVLVAARRTARADRLRIEVRDNGIGIASLHHDRIFEEFFQVDNPERDRRKGLGLGLSICRRIARLLGTEIGLRSAFQKGSTFSFELPLAKAAVAAGPAPLPVPAAIPSMPASQGAALNLRGLLVDDDRLIREATADLLIRWGCRVVTAATVPQALALLDDGGTAPFDFVLSDLQLEQADDGWKVIEAAARHQPAPRLLLISGNTAPETLREVKHRQVTLLTKPVSPARLRAALSSRTMS